MINFKPCGRPTAESTYLTQLTNLGRNKHVHRLLPQALLRGLGGQRRTLRKSFKLAEAEAKAPASVPTREAKADLVKTPSAEASHRLYYIRRTCGDLRISVRWQTSTNRFTGWLFKSS
ncbi:MAG: hypothetical protein ACTS4W_01245 [Candidatus Hodgkinia cicadicola]